MTDRNVGQLGVWKYEDNGKNHEKSIGYLNIKMKSWKCFKIFKNEENLKLKNNFN